MNTLYLKHLLVRTPLERPALWLRGICGLPHRLRHPELREIYLEDQRMHQVMQRLIRPDTSTVDVGCHIGSELSALVRLAPLGRHMAFEPVPQKHQWLCRKFADVDVRGVALSDRDGEVSFWEDLDRPGFSGLGQSNGRCARKITVPCARFDNIHPPPHKIGFMKIDVEGAELFVLRGATRTIRRDRPSLIFESGPGNAEKLGSSRRELFDYITQQLDYRIYHFQDFLEQAGPLDWSSFDRGHRYPFRAFNYLALPTRFGWSKVAQSVWDDAPGRDVAAVAAGAAGS